MADGGNCRDLGEESSGLAARYMKVWLRQAVGPAAGPAQPQARELLSDAITLDVSMREKS